MHLVTRGNYLRLYTVNDTPLPPCESFDTLATLFSDFFCENNSTILSGLTHNANHVDVPVGKVLILCRLTVFEPATQAEINNLLQSSPVKSHELDPFSTWLRRNCAHEVVPLITVFINLSIGALIIISGRPLGGGIVIHFDLRVRTKRIVRHAMYLGRHIAMDVWNRYISTSGSAASFCRAIRLTCCVSPLPGNCAETRHAVVN